MFKNVRSLGKRYQMHCLDACLRSASIRTICLPIQIHCRKENVLHLSHVQLVSTVKHIMMQENFHKETRFERKSFEHKNGTGRLIRI